MVDSFIRIDDEKYIGIARRFYEKKGYRVHSGLQVCFLASVIFMYNILFLFITLQFFSFKFGVELVLYAGESQLLKTLILSSSDIRHHRGVYHDVHHR